MRGLDRAQPLRTAGRTRRRRSSDRCRRSSGDRAPRSARAERLVRLRRPSASQDRLLPARRRRRRRAPRASSARLDDVEVAGDELDLAASVASSSRASRSRAARAACAVLLASANDAGVHRDGERAGPGSRRRSPPSGARTTSCICCALAGDRLPRGERPVLDERREEELAARLEQQREGLALARCTSASPASSNHASTCSSGGKRVEVRVEPIDGVCRSCLTSTSRKMSKNSP